MKRFVQKRSRNPAIIDDVLQEVYLEAFRHIDILKVHQNKIGWIYKTADYKVKKLNSIYNFRIMHEVNLEEWKELETVNDRSEFVEFEEYRKMLKQDEYILLMKKYKEGYTYKDLAKMTGKSVAGSKMQIARIVDKLREN